jgi:hypothetical protein
MLAYFRTRRERQKQRDERMKVLREGLLESEGKVRSSVEARNAIDYCEYCILEYEELYETNEAKWLGWQTVVIVGGVIATLAGVAAIPESWEGLGWLRGVPAGVVTIAAGLMSSFTYKEDAVRSEWTANVLWNELIRYLGRAEPYTGDDDKSDTSKFVNKICDLVEAELQSWRTLVADSRTAESPEPKSHEQPKN